MRAESVALGVRSSLAISSAEGALFTLAAAT
jgi:hypothetical protein